MVSISYPEKIATLFKQIVQQIRSVLDPEYIIIAGSFGKGSWIYSDDRLLSDFEFVFLCNKRWSMSAKKKLLRQLNNEFASDISLKGFLINNVQKKIITNYSLKAPGYLSLDFFDTFKSPQILYRKNKDFHLPLLQNEEVPFWEAWRLLVNRMGHFLEVTLSCGQDKKEKYDYCWLKLFEAAAEGYLIINRRYHPNIDKRLEAFTRESIDADNDLPQNCKNSFSILVKAMQARKKHDISIFNSIDIEEYEKFDILNEWMSFIHKKMCLSENIKDNPYHSYLDTRDLQNKYLLTNFDFKYNICLSNIIQLIHKPFLLRQKYKFYSCNYSSRHVVLLAVSTAFHEVINKEFSFKGSKLILSKIINIDHIGQLNGQKFISEVVNYWKILR